MDIGIKECSKCEHNLQCSECVYPHQVEDMRAELEQLKARYSKLCEHTEKIEMELAKKEMDTSWFRKPFAHSVAPIVIKIQENAIKDYKVKLIYEIVNTPTHKQEYKMSYLDGVAIRQNEIIDIILGVGAKMDGDVG